MGGKRLLPGFATEDYFPQRSVAQKLRRWWDYPWREPKHSGIGYNYSVNNGLGAAYAAFVPLGAVSLLLSNRIRRPRELADKWLILYLLLAVSGLVLLLTVFCEMLRFVLAQVLLAVPVAAPLIDRLIRRFPRAVCIVATMSLAITAAIAAFKPAHALAGRWKDGVWSRPGVFQIPPIVDELPPGARLLNLASPNMTYPLLGRKLALEVITPLHWKLLIAGQPMSARALYENRIDFIYVREPYPDDWPADLPVERIGDDPGLPFSRETTGCLYRVLPRNPTEQSARGNPGPSSTPRNRKSLEVKHLRSVIFALALHIRSWS